MAAERPRDEDFHAWTRRGDAEALARYFDAAAPRLLLIAAHVSPPGIEPEDLVQQTFLEALRTASAPRGEQRVFSWLAAILRNRAVDEHRRRGRRAELALDDTLLEPAASDDPTRRLLDDELFERVVAAIDGLEPPQREVVSLRLVHGMDPATIAHTLGRQPGTVRMQLKRGLERLRGELAGVVGPAALAALSALVANESAGLAAARDTVLAEAARSTAATATLSSSTSLATRTLKALMNPLPATLVASILSVLALLTFAPWENGGAGGPATLDASAMADTSEELAEVVTTPTAVDASSREVASTVDDGTVDKSTVESDDLAEPLVVGRLVDHTDAPVVGATIRWSTDPATPDGTSAGRVDHPDATTDVEGHFALAAAAPPDALVVVTVVASGLPQFGLRIPRAEAGAIDLGTIAYPEMATATLCLVTSTGDPVTWMEGHQPYATHHWNPRPEYVAHGLQDLAATPFDEFGQSIVAHAPVGTLTSSMWEPARFEEVRRHDSVVAGAENVFQIAWPFPDPASSTTVEIELDAIGAPLRLAYPKDVVRLVLSDGTVRTIEAFPMSGRPAVVFDAVPNGYHALEVRIHGFAAVDIFDVEAGGAYTAVARGAARVHLRVLDENGERLGDYRLTSELARSTTLRFGEPDDLRPRGVDVGTHEVYDSVAAIDQHWSVRLEDGRSRRVTLAGLTTGETREVDVLFAEEATVSGIVRADDGTPVAGATIELRPHTSRGPASFQWPAPAAFDPTAPVASGSSPTITGTTASDGGFALATDPGVVYSLFVARSAWSYAIVDATAAPDTHDIVLPAVRTVRGRVEGLDAEALRVLKLLVRPLVADALSTHVLEWRPQLVEFEQDGSFVVTGVGTAEHELAIAYPNSMDVMRTGGSRGGMYAIAAHPLGTLAAGSDDVEDLVLDGAPMRPASVEIVARVDGVPLAQGGVAGIDLGVTESGRICQFALQVGNAGRTRIPWLPPGTWSFAVASMDAPWLVSEPAPRTLAPGASVELVFDIVLVEGRLLLTDPTGAPLAGRQVDVSGPDFDGLGPRTTLTTDDAGGLDLDLPENAYTLRLRRESAASDRAERGAPVAVLWTSWGPATPTVVLAEPPIE
ncbi:ECF RNA polymerase sigma factor SigE [Planctomycetes bacterium Pla163]|uniref:ECF RNA polymerase sigma factor SigE n=1 Tax=Rohdeia mirabilis TaxID=2528008 RepID=A0A518D382_9BACT|nr:ECF RNA polymerase sigma factor SigE [Planctomycetes bacterium Pla163]